MLPNFRPGVHNQDVMEEVVCVVCAQFEPQTWRKSMCKNCFHTSEEHKEEVSTASSNKGEVRETKQTPATGDNTVVTGKDKLSSLKINNGSKTSSSPPPKCLNSPTKTVTATLTSKFGPTVNKNREDGKNEIGKNGSKSVSVSGKPSAESAKRLPTSKQQTSDPKAILKSSPDKKQNGLDTKNKPFAVKDNITKVGQKFGEVKVSESKASLGNAKGCPVSRAEVGKSVSGGASSSQLSFGSGGAAQTKPKHQPKPFATVDKSDDANESKKACFDPEKHSTRTNTDVTGKCQEGEKCHVTAKTLVIGKEKETVVGSVQRTLPGGAASGRSVKIPSSRSFDDGSNKSPSITISLRGGAAEVKIGKTERKSNVTQRSEDIDKEKAREQEFLELKAKEKELLELKAKEKDILSKEKEFKELKAREQDLRDLKSKERELKAKEKEYQLLLAKEKELEKLKSKEREIQDKENEIKHLKLKEQELRNLKAKENDIKAKETEIRKQEDVLKGLKSKLSEMEKKCKELQEENITLKRKSVHDPKGDAEQMLDDLRLQLSSMEERCVKLEEDNTNLKTDLQHTEAAVKKNSHGDSQEMRDLGHRFRESEKDVCQVEDENSKLKREIRELREEMDEMYDTFREQEVDEFRDLQKELEITAKNCRILQFKLRKAERRNEQVENDKTMYEERLRILQSQFESEDTRAHIRKVEEELQMAKEVSVRLHDELDLLEDKKSKAEEDSRHLTELLEQADKKQFRMEMEIDKLRDQIMDLKQELKYASKPESTDRKTMLGSAGRQGSSEYDVSQVMRDLYDSMERENDLKEQLRFTEEETKMMRKKLGELEEENEGLNVQLRKMSRSNKRLQLKEKERFTKESEEADSDGESVGDVEVRIQCELLEQELSVAKKKLGDSEQEKDDLKDELHFLHEKLEEKTQLLSVKPEPSSPNAYYEDKIKQMTIETDDLKWKIIEKEREIERLCAQMNFIQHSHRQQQGKLKKSKSLDSDTQEVTDLRKQLEQVSIEYGSTRERLAQLVSQNERFASENQRLKLEVNRKIPSIQADDAAVENIELKDKVRKLEDDNHSLNERIKTLTESLHTLTKDTRMRSSEVPNIPEDSSPESRDRVKHLESLQAENNELRRKMAELESGIARGSSGEGGGSTIQSETDDEKRAVGGEERQSAVNMDKDPEDMSRLELVERVLDLEDEILDLKSLLKHKDLERADVEREVGSLKQSLEEAEHGGLQRERQLVEEMEMLQEKNTVLSNLLEIVTERADRAEQEIELLMKERASASASDRSASQVSALSNASVGSDDVFLSPPPTDKGPVVQRDWDRQMKKRVESLERLLAEERLKVSTAEKKLLLLTHETLSTAMSDDSKLHLREKELLQHELIESQKHLKIATDQIKGMKERLHAMEEDHTRLKVDYGRVCEQLDDLEMKFYDSDKTPERHIDSDSPLSKRSLPPLKIPHRQSSLEAMSVEQKCAMYKLKAEELQYKVEELNDIWRSKSAASEQEKRDMETELSGKNEEIRVMTIMLEKVKDELCEKEKVITISETTIKEKLRAITRRDEILQEQGQALKQRDGDFTTIMEQISHRDETIRELREAVRNRDERLKEKDDILFKLNKVIESKDKDVKMLSGRIKECGEELNEREAVISVLQQQISHNSIRDTGSETDIEKVNSKLRDTIRTQLAEIDNLKHEKEKILADLKSSKLALDEAMLLWDRDKVYLESSLNVADEKLKLYETLPSMNKEEIQTALKSDAQQYFKEKEKLACDLRNIKKEHASATKNLKELNAKLEGESSEKGRQLRQDMDVIHKQQQDIDRLSNQAEMAYRLQQDERVLRAEYLAMKVRYETRFEKMSKDYSKMLVTIEKLQKERDLDKAIIQGIQKGMASVKENYNADLVRWEDEKARLERQIKEIDETRELAEDLRRRLVELREELAEQERSRTDLVNKFATERSSWDLDRANLRSKINQMEEKLCVTTRAQSRVKETQSHMEQAWEKERAEQKRLLEKAHKLALDLQEQLQSRDETYSAERRALMQQLETERQTAVKEKRERDIAMSELESCGKKLVTLQKRNGELVETHRTAVLESERHKNELLKRLAETKHARAQDSKCVSDILSNLVRLRELGALVQGSRVEEGVEDPKGHGGSEGLAQWQQEAANVDKTVLNYIKESLADITRATDALVRHSKTIQDDRAGIRRSLSSSEIDLLRQELSELQTEGGDVFITHSAKTIDPTKPGDPQPRLQKSSTFDSSTISVSSRPPMYLMSRAPISYSSGSRSAHGSRSTTPDRSESSSPLCPLSPSNIPSTLFSRGGRPKTLQKSVSMDAAPSSRLVPSQDVTSQSVSAGTTPTDHFTPSPFPRPIQSGGHALSPPQVGSLDRLSPRSARRKFFEERPVSDKGFLSWPERKRHHTAAVHHQKQSSLPDPSEVRKVAEEDYYSQVASSDAKSMPQMKPSVSWDEKMHYRVIQAESTKQQTQQPEQNLGQGILQPSRPTSAKDKRRFFKKSSSLEGPVGSSLAKIGTQAMPVAAPSGFMPTDILATVRGKLKFPFKKSKETKSSDSGGIAAVTSCKATHRPTLDASASTSGPTSTLKANPSEHHMTSSASDVIESNKSGQSERGRPSKDSRDSETRWRSQSAERPQPSRALSRHSDVIAANQVWQFSETAV